ncbi:cyclophilin-like domain-containing protein [Hygrophoropsis aurantiaca]|uniref:Cyclophilin-like domain-containing protein n=1 Tax=Hygrophoropsis aurantiaca TaxID=72124 RepID=A0ACB8AHD3_9AGAM|nr:cyclophilin-like domain-containing protein [Hygrophoropsis aurantiaca]
MVNPRVFFDFAIGTEAIGRVIFELDNVSTPKAVENFRSLCTGEKGLSALSDRPLYYKNSIIHRSIRDFMIQGGDFTKRNGTGGESIYGGVFHDEDLSRPPDSEGLLCMANKGPNTNGSQYFVTLRDCPHLNGKHVVFGKVIRGFEEVVKKIAQVSVDSKDRPEIPVVIVNCGELQLKGAKTGGNGKSESWPIHSLHTSTLFTGITSAIQGGNKVHKRRSNRSQSPNSVEDEGRRRKKAKSAKRLEDMEFKNKEQVVVEETEEQYDARLEREELLRIEEAKKKELERIKKSVDNVQSRDSAIRFKGRGRMKFVDPELSQRR